jgi:hypothetical protein
MKDEIQAVKKDDVDWADTNLIDCGTADGLADTAAHILLWHRHLPEESNILKAYELIRETAFERSGTNWSIEVQDAVINMRADELYKKLSNK